VKWLAFFKHRRHSNTSWADNHNFTFHLYNFNTHKLPSENEKQTNETPVSNKHVREDCTTNEYRSPGYKCSSLILSTLKYVTEDMKGTLSLCLPCCRTHTQHPTASTLALTWVVVSIVVSFTARTGSLFSCTALWRGLIRSLHSSSQISVKEVGFRLGM